MAWPVVLPIVLLHEIIHRHVGRRGHPLVVLVTLIDHTVVDGLRVAEAVFSLLYEALTLHGTLGHLLRNLVVLQSFAFRALTVLHDLLFPRRADLLD